MNLNFETSTEKKYQEELFNQSITTIRNGLLSGIILYFLSVIFDLIALPINYKTALLLRFVIVIPSLILTYKITYLKIYKKHHKIILSILAQLAGYAIIMMIAIAQEKEPAFYNYYRGLILVTMWTHLFFRIGYKTVTLNAIITILGYEFVAIFIQKLPQHNIDLFLLGSFFLLVSNLLGTVASYYIEKSNRTEFVLRKEAEKEKKQVIKINNEIVQQKNKILLQNKQLVKQYEISSQFETLVNQLNPHFLFNSLNTLSFLVRSNPQGAVKFINDFSDTYRYILQLKKENIVELDKELAFVKTYENLQKIRFAGNFSINYEISQSQHYFIPPFTLQLLIENAIKHNEISKVKPLWVDICFNEESNCISVSHNLQRIDRKTISMGIGLKNLEKRYEMLFNKKILINETENRFEVSVPVIHENA
jgi:sensor histidine kinase YesM